MDSMLLKQALIKFFAGLLVIVPADDSKDLNVIDRAQEVINGIRQMNEQFFEGIRQRNNELLDKGKEQLKKLTKL